MNYKILVVEDEVAVLKIIRKNLVSENYRVIMAENGEKALNLFYKERPDLLVLDLALPDIQGLEICRTIRKDEDFDNIPIIIISGRISDEDKIEGLSSGADDYLVKPFSMKELVIRVNNALRRIHPPIREENILKEKDLVINLRAETVQVRGKYVKLTNKEFNVLSVLVRKRGSVVTKDYILSKLWGYKFGDGALTRTLDTHVARLRRKLGPIAKKIKTVKNEGYMYLPDVHEIDSAKEALKRSERKFSATLSSLGEAVIITDKMGYITLINNIAQGLTGYKKEAAVGRLLDKIFNLVNEDKKEKVKDLVSRIINKGVSVGLDGRIVLVSESGRKIPVECRGDAIKNDAGNILGVVFVFRDLRIQKLTEYALRRSEEGLRNILDQALMGVMVLQDGLIKYANEAVAGIMGDEAKDIMKWSANEFLKCIHPDDLAFVMEQISKKQMGIKDKVLNNYQIRLIDKRGKIKWVDQYSSTITYNGKPAQLIKTLDITERKQAEELLESEQKKIREYLDIADTIFVVIDSSQKVKLINKKGCEILGYDRDEIIGKNWFSNFLPVRFRKEVKAIFSKLIAGDMKPVEYYENPILRKDGRERSIYWHNIYMKDEKGNITGTISSGQDITDRKELELRSKEIEEKHERMLDITGDVMFVIDFGSEPGDSMIIEVNETACRILGYSKKELVTMKPSVIMVEETDPWGIRKKLLKDNSFSRETTLRTKLGKIIHVRVKGILFNFKGKDTLLAIARDISGLREAEEKYEIFREQLIHAEKLATVATLTSGIAHEFNNLLTVISGQAQIGVMNDISKETRKCFDVISGATNRAADFVKNLMSFSIAKKEGRGDCNIDEILKTVLLTLGSQLKAQNITVIRKPGKIPVTRANVKELQQVFMNIIMNARDAMLQDGGKLTVETGVKNRNIEVTISDTGSGIKKEHLNKVFEPFFTTKGALGDSEVFGSGLGLSICHGIVKNHGGTLRAANRKGETGGAVFTVKLPVRTGARK